MRATTLKCPTCSAPLPVGDADVQRATICLYCDHPVLLRAGTAMTLPPPSAKTADGERAAATAVEQRAAAAAERQRALGRQVKELVAAGRWKEALAAYAEATGTTEAEAGVAIAELVRRLPGIPRLLRRSPINLGAIGIGLLILAGAAAGLVWSLPRASQGSGGAVALALLCAALPALLLYWIVPKIVSTWVFRLGAEGRGTVLRRAVIRSELVQQGGAILLVHFAVLPARGDVPPFEDEEAMLVREESLAKLAPGNVVRVRFSRRTGRTFPVSPIEVLGTSALPQTQRG